jgi:hypothetical protein
MAQDLQKLKDNIWYAKKEFKAQETSYNEWAAQASSKTPSFTLPFSQFFAVISYIDNTAARNRSHFGRRRA